MHNLNFYYKYIVRPQILLKFPSKTGKKLFKSSLKKIIFNVYLDDIKSSYYIYLYNICILLRLLTNKFMYVKKLKKKFNVNKIHMQLSLKGYHMYLFLDIFSTLLLPLFENFNMSLHINNFDIFGNFLYEFKYADPIFMSKNAVTVWSPSNKVNINICFNARDKETNIILLQYLKLKWYKGKNKIC